MELEKATGKAQPACWCVSARFPPDLLTRLPAEAKGQACICAICLARFHSTSSV